MENAEFAYKIQSKLDEFFNEINDLVNNMVEGVSLKGYDMVKGVPLNKPSNPFPFIIVDDYLLRTAPGCIFGNELNKLEKDCKEIERMIPVSKDLNTNFNQSLTKIQQIFSKYINEYNNNYKGFLEKIIEEEKKNYTGIIIDTKHFLETNQYKRLYDICTSLTATLVSYTKLTNQLTGFECNLDIDIIKGAYQRLVDRGYIETKEANFEVVFKPDPISNNFKPVIWKKKSTKNKDLNKKSLIDLLKIVEVNDIDITKVNQLFARPDGASIDIKSSNIFNNKGNDKSEFYSDLKKIFFEN